MSVQASQYSVLLSSQRPFFKLHKIQLIEKHIYKSGILQCCCYNHLEDWKCRVRNSVTLLVTNQTATVQLTIKNTKCTGSLL